MIAWPLAMLAISLIIFAKPRDRDPGRGVIEQVRSICAEAERYAVDRSFRQ